MFKCCKHMLKQEEKFVIQIIDPTVSDKLVLSQLDDKKLTTIVYEPN